jgi:hypothetical protein
MTETTWVIPRLVSCSSSHAVWKSVRYKRGSTSLAARLRKLAPRPLRCCAAARREACQGGVLKESMSGGEGLETMGGGGRTIKGIWGSDDDDARMVGKCQLFEGRQASGRRSASGGGVSC